ncbi:hypothetical protein DPMN_069994 [Dreissena polymorpha]|uniref:Uncharacterized protein n=1 Tax=Dreissena polymorpha TaxID=45954 RepID=A0A9D4BUT5_DREPO|nr:hypothetical protein DPMN_069994 [Dreissena polymorpha]
MHMKYAVTPSKFECIMRCVKLAHRSVIDISSANYECSSGTAPGSTFQISIHVKSQLNTLARHSRSTFVLKVLRRMLSQLSSPARHSR